MKSLFLKDVYNMKHNAKSMIFMLIVFVFLFVPMNGVSSYIGVSGALCSMMIMTTFAFDERSHWEPYAMTMPITREEYVKAKFLVFTFFTFLGVVWGAAIGSIGGIFLDRIGKMPMPSFVMLLVTSGIVFVIMLVLGSTSIPLLFKYGSEKSRLLALITYLIPIIVIAGIGIISFKVFQIEFSKTMIVSMIGPAILFSILWVYSMYRISCKIFKKMELA